MRTPFTQKPSTRIANSSDAAEIAAIYAPFVRDTAISFEADPPTEDEIARRIADLQPQYPWFVACDEGRVCGYAYGSPHRNRAAYRWSVDVSVYVGQSSQRRGVGRCLYELLITTLRDQGYYTAYAGITLPNAASVGLHESLGFQPLCVYPRVGYKNGAWHDVGWWSLQLQLQSAYDTPAEPKPLSETFRL